MKYEIKKATDFDPQSNRRYQVIVSDYIAGWLSNNNGEWHILYLSRDGNYGECFRTKADALKWLEVQQKNHSRWLSDRGRKLIEEIRHA